MPADFESGLFVGQKAWHGMGTTLPADTVLDVHEGLIHSGLNWDVYQVPAGRIGDDGNFHVPMAPAEQKWHPPKKRQNIPGYMEDLPERPKQYWTMRRMLRPDGKGGTEVYEDTLGCVGKKYTILQNERAFGWFDEWIQEGAARIHTAGSLCGGTKVWILAQLTGAMKVGDADSVLPFLLLSSSHDGSASCKVGFTPIRVVCCNTLAMAHGHEASELIDLKHTKGIVENLGNVAETIDLVRGQFQATAKQYEKLLRAGVSRKDVERYVRLCLTEKEDASKLSSKMTNILASKVFPKLDAEINKVGGMENTLWAGYNVVTEYLSNDVGFDGEKESDTVSPITRRENRVKSLWWADNAKANRKALEIAVAWADEILAV